MNILRLKNILILCFVVLFYETHAQWQNIYAFPNPAYALMTSGNTLYAGLGGGGVFASQDSGNNWFAVNHGIQFGGAYIFSLTSQNDSIFAGGFGEVCFSNDGGSDWSLLNLNLGLNNFVYALIMHDNYLFAGVGHDTSSGVYRKPVHESGWTRVNNGLPANVDVNALAIFNSTLWAGTNAGVYFSTNNGLSWTQSGYGMAPGLSVKSLIVANMNILAGTTDGIFYSSDNGNTWSAATGLPPGSIVTCFTGNNNYVVAGTYESVYFSSDNGMKWINFNYGLDSIVSFYSLTTFGNYIFAGTGAGISTTNTVFKLTYDALSVPENDFVTDNILHVFPNPFSDHTVLQSEVLLHDATLTLYNCFGHTVKHMKNINGQSMVLPRNELSAGLYIIRIQDDNKTIATNKIVITD